MRANWTEERSWRARSEGAREREPRREESALDCECQHRMKPKAGLSKKSRSLCFSRLFPFVLPHANDLDISQQSAGSEKGMRQRGLGRECRQSVGVNALFFSSTNQNQSPKSPHINSPLFLTFPKNLKQAFPPFFSSSRQRQEKTQNDQARDRFDPAGRLRGSR